ncbi:MAG: IS110 family RNA-guided transposase [Planctomycetota bacterium]|jgi:transposase
MIYGLDVHKEFIQVCALGAKGSKRKEYRIAGTEEAIAEWARQLGPRDQVVLEATFHTWAIHAIVARTAGRVVVANPMEVKAIAHARIKTDKVDAYTLARLLQADFLPEVVLPDASAWALRQLVSHRRLLVKQRIAIKNTIRSALNRRLIQQPEGDPFSGKTRRWMRSLELPPTERFLLHNNLDLLEAIDERIAAADAELLAVAAVEEQARLLMTIPGVGVNVALGLLAAIGDIHRFPSPEKLSAYLGLVPRVRQSAGRCHHGRITKAGSTLVRSLVVEAAQILARSPSPLATTYWRVRRKRGHNVAVTALARKLVVVAWHLLQKGEPYRYAPAPRTRQKLRALIPRDQRRRAAHSPETLEQVYREAGLPELPPPSQAERRAAAVNRRARTRIANSSART